MKHTIWDNVGIGTTKTVFKESSNILKTFMGFKIEDSLKWENRECEGFNNYLQKKTL